MSLPVHNVFVHCEILGKFGRRPERAKEGDAGYDLFASRPGAISPNEIVNVHTDIAIHFPETVWGRITSRSSSPLMMASGGVIDSGYRGELFIKLFNPSKNWHYINIGDRYAQLILIPRIGIHWSPNPIEAIDDREKSGFGSTGQ